MKRAIFAAISTIFSFIPTHVLHAADNSCVEYGPAVVTLSGKITSHLEYGPPNFGEDPAHDRKDIYWYLDLAQPICVNGKDEGEDTIDIYEEDVRRIQIVFYHGYPGPSRHWVDRRATITGTLFHSITGNHHTSVLIESNSIVKDGN